MADTQSGSIKVKEDVNATALAADVMCHTCIHGVEKTPVQLSEFYQEPVAQVLPPISENASKNIPEKPKKSRKSRQKKTKNCSNTIEQALQMQPTNINKESSNENKKIEVHFTQEPSTSKINPPDSCLLLPKNIKSLAPSAEHGVPEAVSNQDPKTHVMSVSAEEVLTNIHGKPKKSRKPRSKKKKNNSSATEQTLEMQPANINEASSAANKMQIHFIPEPSTSKINSHKNIKTLALSFEQDVPNTISDQDHITKAMPKIAEDVSTNIPEKPKKSKKPKSKKNKNSSNTTEQVPQMQMENINKVSSSIVVKTQAHFKEPSKSMIDAPVKIIKTSTPSAKRVFRNKYSYKFIMPHPVLPVITEETPEDILEKPKKQRKPRQKKKKNHSNAVEQPLQIQLAVTNEASSTAEKFQVCLIQEPNYVEPPKLVETRDETNEMNQKSKTGQQTKKVLAAVESKQHGQENDVVNNNATETKNEKMILPAKNMAMENEKPQTSRDPMQESDEKTERGAQIPVQNYLPAEGVTNDDEKPQVSKDALKDQKAEGNAEAQVKSHLSFFREFYDHSGRLSVRNFYEENLYIDGLYSQGKLTCQDHAIKDKIEEAIHAIMNEITIDFKDFRVPIPTLEILFNRMHNIIFMRLYRIGLTELASIELCNIVAVYRTQFNKADDIKLLSSLL